MPCGGTLLSHRINFGSHVVIFLWCWCHGHGTATHLPASGSNPDNWSFDCSLVSGSSGTGGQAGVRNRADAENILWGTHTSLFRGCFPPSPLHGFGACSEPRKFSTMVRGSLFVEPPGPLPYLPWDGWWGILTFRQGRANLLADSRG